MAASSKEMKLAIKIAGKVDSSLKSGLTSVKSGIKGIAKIAASACTAAATAIAGLATAAVKVGKEFESSMSQVAATMGLDKSTKEGQAAYATLEEAAKEMGATTAFSASEAAEGLNYLALAGYTAEEAATALPYTLKLAGAGAMELADASDMVTDAMSALNLEANEENLSKFSDQLAKSASTTNTSVAQLGEAILTVGGTAANLKGGTAELNTALGILANNGIKGAEGGTHLRNMLLSLESPTDKAAAALKDLGVNVYDAQGNLRSINDIFVDVQKGMEGMTNEQKDSILAAIFNKRDLASARAIMSAAGDEFADLEKTIAASAGACDQMYSTQLDNLEGDISIFKSALEGLGIEVYENIGGGVRDAVQLGTECLGDLTNAFKEGGLEGLVGEVGTVLSKIVSYIADMAPTIMDAAVDLVTSLIEGLSNSSDKIADSAALVLSKFVDGCMKMLPQLAFLGINLIISLASAISAELPNMLESIINGIATLGEGLLQLLPELMQAGIELLQAIINGIVEYIPVLFQTSADIVSGLCKAINDNLPQILQMGIQLIMSLIYGIIEDLPSLIQTAMQLINTVVQCILQNLPIIISAGMQLLYALINGIMNNLDQIIAAALTLVGELVAGLAENAPMLLSAAISLIITLASCLIQQIPQLLAAIPQIIMAIINAFGETNWGTIGNDIIQGIKDGLLGAWESLKETAKNIWNSIKSIFSKKITTDVSVNNNSSTPSKHASGGVFTQSTLLPSINGANHIVGEAGAEAILPLDTLWKQMSSIYNPQLTGLNEKLNVLAEKMARSTPKPNGKGGDSSSQAPVITYSPTIIVQGNASKEDIEDAERKSQAEFEKMFKQMMKEYKRTKF